MLNLFPILFAWIFCALLSTDGEARADSVSPYQAQTLNKSLKEAPSEIERLTLKGCAYKDANDLNTAEKLFKQALSLCESSSKTKEDSRSLESKEREKLIVSNLIGMYKEQARWADAEMLYETKMRKLFSNSDSIDEQVAKMLIQQGKYTEARAVLRSFVSEMPQPITGPCGYPRERYLELKELLQECEKKTPSITNVELDKVIRDRKQKYHSVAD